MSWDNDTYMLNGRWGKGRYSTDDLWKERWEERHRCAFAGGAIDHRPDLSAPFGTLARYGYLVPLTGDALILYKEYKHSRGVWWGMSDRERFEFEREYIQQYRAKNVKKTG